MLLQLRQRSIVAVLAVVALPLPSIAAAKPRHARHHRHGAGHRRTPGKAPRHAGAAPQPGSWQAPGQPTATHRVLRLALGAAASPRGAHHARRLARAAGDPAATISDFKFTPGTVTIHVGDTVTWTNAGPSEHTASARNGSFDSGVLRKNGSFSHTFTSAGTFSYFCQIHPFMHGTVVVVAAAGSSPSANTTPTTSSSQTTTTTTSSGQTSTAAAHSATASSAPSLPMTGLDLGVTLLSGGALLGLGLGIRRLLSAAAGESGE